MSANHESFNQVVVDLIKDYFKHDEKLCKIALEIFEAYLKEGGRGVEKVVMRMLSDDKGE